MTRKIDLINTTGEFSLILLWKVHRVTGCRPLIYSNMSNGFTVFLLFTNSTFSLDCYFAPFCFDLSCDGNMEMFWALHPWLCNKAVMDVVFPLEVFCLWQSLSISVHIGVAQCAVMQWACCLAQNWFMHLPVMEFFLCVLFCSGPLLVLCSDPRF